MITDINQLDLNRRYTYAEYLSWQFQEMVELIRGRVVQMSPAPGTLHQSSSGNLFLIIGNYLRNKNCRIFSAPFDVRLPSNDNDQAFESIETVVQPDISVICDLSKLDDKGCNGAPDWIIEILSKSTASKDLTDKFELYQHAGVREYWIIHPTEATVIPYRLNADGKYQALRPNPFTLGENIPVSIFSDFTINVDEIFR